MKTLTHGTASNPTAFADYAFTYDAGNRVQALTNSVHTAENARYSYDYASQLIAATYVNNTSANEANSFDNNGNPNATGNVVGAGNVLLSDGSNNYTFDAAGNMLAEKNISTGAEIDYAYDNRNRLTSVTNKDSGATITQVVGYTYDLFNSLIGRSITPYSSGLAGTTTTTRIVYDGDRMVLAFDGSGNLTNRFLNPRAIDQILANEQVTSTSSAGTVAWLLPDNEGTIRDIVDSSGLEDHLIFNSFGLMTGQSGSSTFSGTDLIFSQSTGALYDSATDLSYHNDSATGIAGRWYNPSIQRWMSRDADGLGPDSNPFRYCDNSPTNGIDPSGLAMWFGSEFVSPFDDGASFNVLGNIGNYLSAAGTAIAGTTTGAVTGGGSGAATGAAVGGIVTAPVGGEGALPGLVVGGGIGVVVGGVTGFWNSIWAIGPLDAAKRTAVPSAIAGGVSAIIPGAGAGLGATTGGGLAAAGGATLGGGATIAGATTGELATGTVIGGVTGLAASRRPGSTGSSENCPERNTPKRTPASEKTAKDIAKQIERDLGKNARRAFHDAKEGGVGDRTLEELKADAQALYNEAGKDIPSWLR